VARVEAKAPEGLETFADLAGAGQQAASFAKSTGTAGGAPNAEEIAAEIAAIEWATPKPISAKLPEFPTEVLGWVAPGVEAIAVAKQVPPDLVGMLFLAAASAMVRKRIRVQVKPGWDEPLNLWVANVLEAGENKSAVVAQVAAPLDRIEQTMIDLAPPRIAKAASDRRLAEKRVQAAELAAIKAKNLDDRRAREAELEGEQAALDRLPTEAEPQLRIADATPEALVAALADQGGALALLSSEGGFLSNYLGRYSSGEPNLDALLQAHDGRESIVVNRKGHPILRVPAPSLAVGIAVQRDVLVALGKSQTAIERGLAARFLYSVPASLVGARNVEPVIDEEASQLLSDALVGIGLMLGDPPAMTVRDVDLARKLAKRSSEGSSADIADQFLKDDFKLSSSSIATHSDYRRALEKRRHPQLGDIGMEGHLAKWANKLDGQLARLAALLHLIDLSGSL